MVLETQTSRRVSNFSVGVLLFNLVVILGGALVRATKSGAGCGAHWPLCDGQVVPGLQTFHQMVEFSHRMLVGVGMLLVLWLYILVRKNFPAGSQARSAVTATAIFTLSEALIGAALVLFKWVGADQSVQRVFAVSAHLINTFLLVASLALTYWFTAGKPTLVFKGQGKIVMFALTNLFVSAIIGISGAITALGDTLFPAKSTAEIGRVVASKAHFIEKLRVVHPVIAIVGLIIIILSITKLMRTCHSDEVKNFAFLSGILGVLQMGLGFFNLYSLAPLTLQLAHLLVADVFWISLVFLGAASLSDHGKVEMGGDSIVLSAEPGSAVATGTSN